MTLRGEAGLSCGHHALRVSPEASTANSGELGTLQWHGSSGTDESRGAIHGRPGPGRPAQRPVRHPVVTLSSCCCHDVVMLSSQPPPAKTRWTAARRRRKRERGPCGSPKQTWAQRHPMTSRLVRQVSHRGHRGSRKGVSNRNDSCDQRLVLPPLHEAHALRQSSPGRVASGRVGGGKRGLSTGCDCYSATRSSQDSACNPGSEPRMYAGCLLASSRRDPRSSILEPLKRTKRPARHHQVCV